jgi:hypothetical protein
LGRRLEQGTAQRRRIGGRGESGIGNRAHQRVYADLTAEVRLGRRQIGYGLQQREPCIAEIHHRTQ